MVPSKRRQAGAVHLRTKQESPGFHGEEGAEMCGQMVSGEQILDTQRDGSRGHTE